MLHNQFEFDLNRKSFEELMAEFNFTNKWAKMSTKKRERVVEIFLDCIELSNREKRFKVIQAILYLVQGVFDECATCQEQEAWSSDNVFLLYENGLFQIFVQLLHMEMEFSLNQVSKKTASNITDSTNLRMILNVLYTFIEVINRKCIKETDKKKVHAFVLLFKSELN